MGTSFMTGLNLASVIPRVYEEGGRVLSRICSNVVSAKK